MSAAITFSSPSSEDFVRFISSEATSVLLTLLLVFTTITVYYAFVKPNAKLKNVPEGTDVKILKHKVPFLGDVRLYNARDDW